MIITGQVCDFLGRHKGITLTALLATMLAPGGHLQAQTTTTDRHGSQARDPGIRGGPAGAGDPITALTAGESNFFTNSAKPEFVAVEGAGEGLGPRFNLDSCAGCHIHPAVGGSSPPQNNPQVVRQPAMAPRSAVPWFLDLNGPIREVRFVRNADGTPDGGVHGIFTISGRADSLGCNIEAPNFSNTSNLVFRIPTPVFGAGLLEAITDTTIRNNLASDPGGSKARAGVRGHVNTNGNDGTVTRLGWKAQNKSLMIFSGEAYNVEMGVTNENFPNEREENSTCATNGTPENRTTFGVGQPAPGDIVNFTAFMKFLDQPKPACGGNGEPACESVTSGNSLFQQIGCALCHTPTLTTGRSSTLALNQKVANLFSDLAVHHMGTGLADGVSQGNAGPDEFRSAPLWGVGKRAFFLHDGRTSDLLQAILAHGTSGSEAVSVIDSFQSLRSSQQQDILNFLRSL